MLNKFASFIQSAVAKYKARRVNVVVRSFFLAAEQNSAIMLSACNVAAQHIVNKTEADATPLLNLIGAMQQCADHYGPGLIEIFEDVSTQLARSVETNTFVMEDAINATREDTKE